LKKKAMEDLGSLNMVLRYDSHLKTLMVTIMEAEDIPVRDLSGYAYSFVVAKAKNTFKKNNIQKEYKTKLVRAGFWPSFNDTIEIEIEKEDLDDEVLDLYLCETNQWTKRVGIGQISIEIGKLDLCTKEEQILRKKLKPYNPLADVDVESGSVQIAFDYDREEWKLTAEVIRASIIPADEEKEKKDSYVTLSFWTKEEQLLKKVKTKTQKGTICPEFGDKLSVNIPDTILPDVKVEVKLKASRLVKIGKNPLIGVTEIKPEYWERVWKDGEYKGWFQVFKLKK